MWKEAENAQCGTQLSRSGDTNFQRLRGWTSTLFFSFAAICQDFQPIFVSTHTLVDRYVIFSSNQPLST